MKKYKCPCCGYYTLDTRNEYNICKVCFWEDDPGQRENETDNDGANKVSLIQARANYQEFGACEAAMLQYVRKPKPDEFARIEA